MTDDFQPLTDADWPPAIDDLRQGFAGGLNVYRVMAHHPRLLRAWAPLRQHVVIDSALGPQRSEVVILRTGWHMGSDYEWGQHVVRGRKTGLSDDRIAALRGPLDQISGDDAVLARAVDDLIGKRRLSARSMADLRALTGDDGMFDLIATVGFYATLGYMLNSCHTPLDDDIAADLRDHPAP